MGATTVTTSTTCTTAAAAFPTPRPPPASPPPPLLTTSIATATVTTAAIAASALTTSSLAWRNLHANHPTDLLLQVQYLLFLPFPATSGAHAPSSLSLYCSRWDGAQSAVPNHQLLPNHLHQRARTRTPRPTLERRNRRRWRRDGLSTGGGGPANITVEMQFDTLEGARQASARRAAKQPLE